MHNRDYFTRPKQANGRSAHSYGHTHLDREEARKEWITWVWLGLFGFVTGVVMFMAFVHAVGEVGA